MKFNKFLIESGNFLAHDTASKIEQAIRSIGGNIWVVGGAVRDRLMPDLPQSKDVDLVVTDLPQSLSNSDVALNSIIDVLKPISKKVGLHGESFGVIKAIIDGEDLDIAIPRAKEEKTGVGHTDFSVDLDPTASIETDLARRELTFNAMAQSLDGKTIVDPFGGQKDISNKMIRAVGNADNRISEDPLRMARIIQFAARFGFDVEPKTMHAIKNNAEKIKTVSGERILEELKKALTKGKADSNTLINLLHETGIGQEIFGDSFSPISVNVNGERALPARFIGLFLRGGDVENIKPTKKLLDTLRLAKEFFLGENEPWQFVKQHKDKLPAIHAFFSNAKGMDNIAEVVKRAMELPMTPKELAVSGKDLLDLGMKGASIGVAQNKMLQSVWNGTPNQKEELMKVVDHEISN